jgi:putative DNA primase/helicase
MDTSNRRPEGWAGSTVAPALQDHIRSAVADWHAGTTYQTCPECSHTRRKKRARCLSITTHDDRAVYWCHHCEVKGVVFRDGGSSLSQSERTERRQVSEAALRLDLQRRIDCARQVWNSTLPAAGTAVERYLRYRGFDLVEIPATLRYGRLRHPGTGEYYDAMVAGVGYGPVSDAVHRTFLAPGGNGKARLPDDMDVKMSLGPVRGRPIRLDATVDADAASSSLAVAEGIENALVAVQEFGLPAWSSVSAGNMPLLHLPDDASLVTIMADHDETGLTKAKEAARNWSAAGRTVRLALPDPGEDFNDMLRMCGRKETA